MLHLTWLKNIGTYRYTIGIWLIWLMHNDIHKSKFDITLQRLVSEPDMSFLMRAYTYVGPWTIDTGLFHNPLRCMGQGPSSPRI